MLTTYFKCLCIAALILLPFHSFSSSKKEIPTDSLRENKIQILQATLQRTVSKYKGLGAGIAILNNHEKNWVGGFGYSDIDKRVLASEHTMFRIGSISKMFVALSILKLQEEGKLSLQDKIKDFVPEVAFENRWEETDPVRIIHLLEHTTGWDEMHLIEITHNQFPPISLQNALAFHPHSRKSRWIPGSRMSYTNTGYAVAAYIVQKVSGHPYEEYVQKAILKPLQMEYTTFFNDFLYKQWGAQTYNHAMEKVSYKQELYRPATAMSSSAADMAHLLQMLLKRGSIDSLKLFDKASIERMETSKSTPGAQAGLELGYGLGNFTSTYQGFTYHGHQGAIEGGLSKLAYLPEHGLGHVILLNANNRQAMQEISAYIQAFETQMLAAPQLALPAYEGPIGIEEGYYLAINPRNQNRFYQDLIINIDKIEVQGRQVTRSWIVPGPKTSYYPLSPTKFTSGKFGKVSLVAAVDPLAGKVLYTEGVVLKPISAFRVIGQLLVVGFWFLLMILCLCCFLLLSIVYLTNRNKYSSALVVCMYPSLTSLFFLLFVILQRLGFKNVDILLSTPSLLSISLMSLSILFALGAIASVIVLYRWRMGKIAKIIYWPMMVLSFLHLLVAAYLVYFGVIPLMSWA